MAPKLVPMLVPIFWVGGTVVLLGSGYLLVHVIH